MDEDDAFGRMGPPKNDALPTLTAKDLRTRSPSRRRRKSLEEQHLLVFEPSSQLSLAVSKTGQGRASFTIENPAATKVKVAFKVKTNQVSLYLVSPSSQILSAGEKIVITVTLLKNETTSALLEKEGELPSGGKFLIQSAALDPVDMSTMEDKKELAKMWSSTRWRNKIQNKKIGIKLFRSAVVSDDSEDDDDDDDDDSSDPDVARVGVASASRTTTPLSNAVIGRHARARAGAEALAHQPRNRTSVSPRTASAASSLSGFGSVHTGGGGATGTGTGSRSASLSGRSLSPSGGSSDVVTMADAADGLPPLPESARGALFPWRCGELLGQGRSGRVYKAMRSDTGELIAMKVLDVASARSQAQIMKEVEVLRQLDHEHVVKYLGYECEGVSARTPVPLVRIFMEYVSGGSLSKTLRTYGPMDEGLIRKYTRQILEGLAYVHMHNIAHRDIKGANVLVTDRGVVKLADFGACKTLPDESLDPARPPDHTWATKGSVASPREQGTPQWMAPEVVKGQVTGRGWQQADVWSLGCTIIEMATGQPPWPDASNPATIMIRIASSDPTIHIPAHLSPEARDLINQCLRREPGKRPTSLQLLNHPFVNNRPVGIVASGASSSTVTLASAAIATSPMVRSESRPGSGLRSIRLAAVAEAASAVGSGIGDAADKPGANTHSVSPPQRLRPGSGAKLHALHLETTGHHRSMSASSSLSALSVPLGASGTAAGVPVPPLSMSALSDPDRMSAPMITTSNLSTLAPVVSPLKSGGSSAGSSGSATISRAVPSLSVACDHGGGGGGGALSSSSSSNVGGSLFPASRLSPLQLPPVFAGDARGTTAAAAAGDTGAAAAAQRADGATPEWEAALAPMERDHLFATIDRGRADMYMVVANIDDIGWAVYESCNPSQTWTVDDADDSLRRHVEADAAANMFVGEPRLASTSSSEEHGRAASADTDTAEGGNVVGEDVLPAWQGDADDDGGGTAEWRYDGGDIDWSGAHGLGAFDGDWDTTQERSCDNEAWERWFAGEGSGDAAGYGEWHAEEPWGGAIQQLVAGEECRDTANMTDGEKAAALRSFQRRLFRLVHAWPEGPSALPLPPPSWTAAQPRTVPERSDSSKSVQSASALASVSAFASTPMSSRAITPSAVSVFDRGRSGAASAAAAASAARGTSGSAEPAGDVDGDADRAGECDNPTLLAGGLMLHWLHAARCSIRRKAGAEPSVDELISMVDDDAPVAAAEEAEDPMEEWYTLGKVELKPWLAFHAVSEHVAKVRCQATETNSAFAGFRMLAANAAALESADDGGGDGSAVVLTLKDVAQLLKRVVGRSEDLATVAGHLTLSQISLEQCGDGWVRPQHHNANDEVTVEVLDDEADRSHGDSDALESSGDGHGLSHSDGVGKGGGGGGRSVGGMVVPSLSLSLSSESAGTTQQHLRGLAPISEDSAHTDVTAFVPVGARSRQHRRQDRERVSKAMEDAAKVAAAATGDVSAPADKRQSYVRALARYVATDDGELSIEEGDVILVLRKDDSGWWEGQCRGRTGWFPSNFCQVKYDLYTISEVDTPRSGWSASMMSQNTAGSSLRSSVQHRGPAHAAGAGDAAETSSTYSGRGGPAPRVAPIRRR